MQMHENSIHGQILVVIETRWIGNFWLEMSGLQVLVQVGKNST